MTLIPNTLAPDSSCSSVPPPSVTLGQFARLAPVTPRPFDGRNWICMLSNWLRRNLTPLTGGVLANWRPKGRNAKCVW